MLRLECEDQLEHLHLQSKDVDKYQTLKHLKPLKSECDQKYHNYTRQTSPWHGEEE